MRRPNGDQLLKWAAFALPGAVGMYAAEAVAGLSFIQSAIVALTVGAVAGGAFGVIVALRRRDRH
jgi:hypothetical protein